MDFIDESSLAITLDSFNETVFRGEKLDPKAWAELALWLAERQGLKGSYAGMFAPTARDFQEGIRLFTGEKISSRAATAHILGEETCRALLILNDPRPEVKDSLQKAQNSMFDLLTRTETERSCGIFCCGPCTVSLWRHLVKNLNCIKTQWLSEGLKILRQSRQSNGEWKRFPFYWTLLGLSELDPDLTRPEILYTASIMERRLKRITGAEPWASRRRILLERLLARV